VDDEEEKDDPEGDEGLTGASQDTSAQGAPAEGPVLDDGHAHGAPP
jgi:hypothetical protein